jgi:hypothetical protein
VTYPDLSRWLKTLSPLQDSKEINDFKEAVLSTLENVFPGEEDQNDDVKKIKELFMDASELKLDMGKLSLYE